MIKLEIADFETSLKIAREFVARFVSGPTIFWHPKDSTKGEESGFDICANDIKTALCDEQNH